MKNTFIEKVEDEDDQSPAIKFKFTEPISIITNDLAEEKVRTDIVKEGILKETDKEVLRTGKQFQLKLRTDIFKEGVVSFSSMNTHDSHTFSSNGNVFLTDSAISSTQSYEPRDFNNSQSDDQIMHDLTDSAISSTPRDFNNSQSEDQIMLEDGDLRRKLRKRKLENDERERSIWKKKNVTLYKIKTCQYATKYAYFFFTLTPFL